MQLRFTKSRHKITPRKKSRRGPGRGAPHNCAFPSDISATAGASNFKFGMQLWFAEADSKITLTRSGRVRPFVKLSKFGVFFNISAMAEASEFKVGTQLAPAKVHDKTLLRGKVGVAMG